MDLDTSAQLNFLKRCTKLKFPFLCRIFCTDTTLESKFPVSIVHTTERGKFLRQSGYASQNSIIVTAPNTLVVSYPKENVDMMYEMSRTSVPSFGLLKQVLNFKCRSYVYGTFVLDKIPVHDHVLQKLHIKKIDSFTASKPGRAIMTFLQMCEYARIPFPVDYYHAAGVFYSVNMEQMDIDFTFQSYYYNPVAYQYLFTGKFIRSYYTSPQQNFSDWSGQYARIFGIYLVCKDGSPVTDVYFNPDDLTYIVTYEDNSNEILNPSGHIFNAAILGLPVADYIRDILSTSEEVKKGVCVNSWSPEVGVESNPINFFHTALDYILPLFAVSRCYCFPRDYFKEIKELNLLFATNYTFV
jgi:hypothetical protein